MVSISPEGIFNRELLLPSHHIICPPFFVYELFITSRAETSPELFPESVRFAGHVFRVKVGVRGPPINKFNFQKEASV